MLVKHLQFPSVLKIKYSKQSSIRSIFSTQKINRIIYSNKLVRLQRTIKAFLRRKGFYTKVFLSSIRGKIKYSVQSYIFNILYTLRNSTFHLKYRLQSPQSLKIFRKFHEIHRNVPVDKKS